MSIKNRGSSLRSRAPATNSLPKTHSPEPVELTTTSAAGSSSARESKLTATPPTLSASDAACPAVRLAIRISRTPLPLRYLTTSPLISPALRIRVRLPPSVPKTSSVIFNATRATESELFPRPVSERTRLPTRRAVWKSRLRIGPVLSSSVAARYASRTCPRIWPSPTTIESSELATRYRCRTASSSVSQYECRVRQSSPIPFSTARALKSISFAPSSSTTAQSSVRLQVERRTASATEPSFLRRRRKERAAHGEKAILSRTSTGAERWLIPATVTSTLRPPPLTLPRPCVHPAAPCPTRPRHQPTRSRTCSRARTLSCAPA